MRDFRDAKAMAQTLRDAFTAKGVSLTHSESLELIARTLGFHDWNELAARIASERKPPDAEPPRLPSSEPARQEIAVDAAILDGYVGFYQHTDSFVMTVTRDGNQLFTRYTGQSPVPVYPTSNTEFFVKVVDAQISFITDTRGRAESLILHQNGRDMPMKRIDARTAQQIESKRAEKLKSQSPSPGNEAALRRLVDGLISGKPNYDEMSPELVKAAHDQLPNLHSDMAQLGSVQSIGFVGVGNGARTSTSSNMNMTRGIGESCWIQRERFRGPGSLKDCSAECPKWPEAVPLGLMQRLRGTHENASP